MLINQVDLAEKRLNKLARLSLFHQGFWLLLLNTILIFKPHYFREIASCLGCVALSASFIASKIYIYAGKDVEELKSFSEVEIAERQREYWLRFFLPYVLWTSCIVIFSRAG
jgi:hypothetical protein